MSEITTSLSWRELRDLIDTIPEEDLDNGIVVNDGGSETFVSELVMTDKWLYLKGF